VLKDAYGQDTEFIVYDSHAEVAKQYHKGINYRLSLFDHYKSTYNKRFARIRLKYNVFSSLKRLMIAANLYAAGFHKLAFSLLGKEEAKDFHHYASADLIVTTGGTYLVENYSLESRIFDFSFTNTLGKPLVFFTQSLGPFKKPDNQQHFKRIFDQAVLILLRDQASYQNLVDIGINISRSKVVSDIVFSDTNATILEAAKKKVIATPLNVAISVRDWKYFKGRTQEEGVDKYFRSVAAICEYVVLQLKGNITFVSTCQAIKEYHVDDSKTAKNIYKLLSEETKNNTKVDDDFHNPEGFKSIISKFDVVISTRMHVAIQALNMGIPVLPIAYEFKTTELFSKLIDKELILNIDTITEEGAVQVFKKYLEQLPVFRESLFNGVSKEHQSALEPVKYLKELLPLANQN
jgi:colanic acid/amylovoran biosynthesis protein